jgi:hypothetical protein
MPSWIQKRVDKHKQAKSPSPLTLSSSSLSSSRPTTTPHRPHPRPPTPHTSNPPEPRPHPPQPVPRIAPPPLPAVLSRPPSPTADDLAAFEAQRLLDRLETVYRSPEPDLSEGAALAWKAFNVFVERGRKLANFFSGVPVVGTYCTPVKFVFFLGGIVAVRLFSLVFPSLLAKADLFSTTTKQARNDAHNAAVELAGYLFETHKRKQLLDGLLGDRRLPEGTDELQRILEKCVFFHLFFLKDRLV